MKTCQEISGLYEQGKITRISLGDKLALRIHGSICKGCRDYFKESDILDKMLSRKFKDLGNYKFSDTEKAKIKERLNQG